MGVACFVVYRIHGPLGRNFLLEHKLLMNAPYVIKECDGKRYVSCCANCFPGNKIWEAYPELKGLDVSHGVCADCKAVMLRRVLEIKLARIKSGLAQSTVL